MKTPLKPNRHNNLAYQAKFDEREIWHKLVVKIICWKDGLTKGGAIKLTNKITAKEWDTYSKRTVKTNTTYGRQRVLTNLKATRDKIEEHGGFEEARLLD